MRSRPTSLNRQQIVRVIHHHGPISRVEIAKRTGLSATWVGDACSDLLARGFITETPVGSIARGRGRPRVSLEINAQGMLVLGASVSWHGVMAAGFVNLSGDLVHQATTPVGFNQTYEALADDYARALNTIIADSPFAPAEIARIALAVPGAVDSRTGQVHWLSGFPRGSVALADALQARLGGLAVTLESDFESMARARYWFPDSPVPSSFTLVYVGVSVGASHYVNDAPRVSADGVFEFGHVKTDFSDTARPCFCGARGCLTTYCSTTGILDKLGDWDGHPTSLQAFEELLRLATTRAELGDTAAQAMFDQAGRHLGLALANLINADDPGHVIVQTSTPALAKAIEASLMRTITANTLPFLLDRTAIRMEVVSDDWRWKGAAALALEQLFLRE